MKARSVDSFFLTEARAEETKALSDPPEKLLLLIGGWLAARAYATAPEGLRLYYHVVGGNARRQSSERVGIASFRLVPIR